MSLYADVYAMTHDYVRKGGKRNRNQQRNRILEFVKFIEKRGVCSLGQIGERHVIQYWKKNRNLSDATLYSHWLAIRVLWELCGKSGEPPKPWYQKDVKIIDFI
jgi:hypothetical protein